MLAINPKDGDPNLLWRFYQCYEDGFKEEITQDALAAYAPGYAQGRRLMPDVIFR